MDARDGEVGCWLDMLAASERGVWGLDGGKGDWRLGGVFGYVGCWMLDVGEGLCWTVLEAGYFEALGVFGVSWEISWNLRTGRKSVKAVWSGGCG